MNKNVFLLFVWLCTIMAGPVLAGNTEQQPVAWKGFGKVRNERAMQLRTDEADAANISLRSTLESGHNRPDSAIYYNVYENEQHPEMKRVFTYAGDVVKETVYGREWESGEWRNDVLYEEEYTFDAYGNKTLSIYRWYSEGEFYSASKEEYTYNSNATPLYERYYSWENSGWALNSEVTYQYDARGVMTGGTFYDSNIGKVIFPLTVSGTPENLEVSITVDGVILLKSVLHFDPVTMKLLGIDYFEMNRETGVMEPDSGDEYTYDRAGRLLMEFYWDNNYVNKTEYVYDAAGRKLSIITSEAENRSSPFAVSNKKEYEYAGDRLVRLNQYADYQDGLGLVLHEIIVFFYSGDTGNGQVTLAEVSVYPNPVTDVFTVSGVQAGATLTVTSLSGSAVLRQTLTDTQTTLSAASLPPGIYFVTVRSGKGTATFKIIKK